MEIAKPVLEYIKATIWPFSVIIFLVLFRRQMLEILARTKKINLPGGISVETFDKQIEKAKELGEKVKEESKQRIKEEKDRKLKRPSIEPNYSKANKSMLELGLTPSPSGLEIEFYEDLIEKDPRLALAGLRLDLELMLII